MERYNVQPLDLMQFVNTKYHDPFIHEKIELESELDQDRLVKALDTLLRVFPLLKCRYDSQKNEFAGQEQLTGRQLLRIVGSADGDHFLTEALDMDEKLIQFTCAGTTLYVTVSHLICDGSGFKQLLYLLCDIYNGSFSEDYDHLMTRELSQLTDGLTGRTGMTLQMLLSVMGNYKNKPVYSQSGPERPYVVERVISREVMDRAYAAAKKQGATLNDVFLTAYARALGSLYGLKKVNIPCTVDLRKYTDKKTGIANLTGTYNLNVKLRDGETFAGTLSTVHTKMQRQKMTKNDIAGPMLLVSKYESSSLESFLKLYGGMDTSAFTDYTNLGVLDADRLVFQGNTVKNAVGYSGLNKAPCFMLAISSFKGETTLSSLFQCGEAEREKAVRVVEAVAEGLESFAAQQA